MFANILYLVALLMLSPVILYRMIRHGRYRRGIGEKFFGLSAKRARQMRDGSDCVWFHAVSVGEVNLLPGIVRRCEQACPQKRVVVSTSTDTGYDLAVKHFGADRVFFCPLDFTWAVGRTLRNLAPYQLVLVELELWPNLVRGASRRGHPVMVVNGRLSERSALRYQRMAKWTQTIFEALDWVGCQSEACRDRFAACGTPSERLHVTGSIKFDDAPTSRKTPGVETCLQWGGIDSSHCVWVVGSTQGGEERMAIDIYQSLRRSHPHLRLVLVPRHQERFDEVAALVTTDGMRVHRRSRDNSLPRPLDADTVILVDTIGELRHWWGVGRIATVGGSFGSRGGQNMLEPAGYGCAVSFGPNTRNFHEIAEALIENHAAARVNDQRELQMFVQRCLTDVPFVETLGKSARELVDRHRGATVRTIEVLCRDGMQGIRAA